MPDARFVPENRMLKTLLEVGTLLSATLDLDSLMDLTMDMVCRVFRAGASSLLLIDRQSDTLFFRTSAGEKREAIKRVRLKMGQGIAGWVAKEGRPFWSNDLENEPRFAREISQMLGYETRSIMAVPLRWESRIIGVIEVLNSLAGTFTEEDLKTLEALSTHVAACLLNARAYTDALVERDHLKAELEERYQPVGASLTFQAVVRLARKAARANTTVLLRGESGTGKEVVARLIHRESPRRDRALVAVNCAALSDQLLESELFGHERGAFTGADRLKKGRFELAQGGTIFLDEIACMSVELQAKLLRAIQNREIDRVGGMAPIPIDVRIVAATNANLETMVKQGRFREDLYWRLNVISITLPPLRERKEDIPTLVDHFVARYSRETGKTIRGMSPGALDVLMGYEFPGNIRELENMVERAVVLEDEESIQPERLPVNSRPQAAAPIRPATGAAPAAQPPPAFPAMTGKTATLDDLEKMHIQAVFAQCRYRKSQACRVLGISRPTLDRKLTRYGIAPPGAQGPR